MSDPSHRGRVRSMMAAARADEPAPTYGPGFWIGLAVGVPILVYGTIGLLGALRGVQLTSWLRFVVGGAVIHDVVVGPLVCLIGWLVVRFVPPMAKAAVTAALLASGVMMLLSWPFIRGYGRTSGEPSFLSRNYADSLAICLAAVWAMAAMAVLIRAIRARPRHRSASGDRG